MLTIKDKEMPPNCYECDFWSCTDYGYICHAGKFQLGEIDSLQRYVMCPLGEGSTRHKGKWIGKPIGGFAMVRCSQCKEVYRGNTGRWNYCPNCGADMRGDVNGV